MGTGVAALCFASFLAGWAVASLRPLVSDRNHYLKKINDRPPPPPPVAAACRICSEPIYCRQCKPLRTKTRLRIYYPSDRSSE